MRKSSLLIIFAIMLMATFAYAKSGAKPGDSTSSRPKVPVKEITIFKDGHAFVLQEGPMPTDSAGNVFMDYLPTPVLGTFWPYSFDNNAKLIGVVAGQRRVNIERTSMNIEDLLAANTGAEVLITEKAELQTAALKYAATIVGIPTRTTEELDRTSSSDNNEERLPQASELVLLKTSDGIKAVAIAQIKDVTFKQTPKMIVAREELRKGLTLKLDWGKGSAASTAKVGLVYIQKGIRWIPNYRITLDGNGNATIKLQATLLNELIDLENVTANLVIGVPSFAFEDTIDPISLSKTAAQLSQYFQNNQNLSLSNARSNIITNQQVSRMSENADADVSPGELGPDLPAANRNEDLFIFHLNNISLKKGQRMVITIGEQTVKYKDIYTLNLPSLPPPELQSNFSSQQISELAKLKAQPKFMHKIRIANTTGYPFTTAPALLVRDEKVLSESLMTFTAAGASTDVEVTAAVDIGVKKKETEMGRNPNAAKFQGYDYGRIDLAGNLKINNYRKQPVYIEITRNVLGNIGTATNNGAIESTNLLEDEAALPFTSYYNWPSWWAHFNGVGRITWKMTLEPGKGADLNYTWHYFWR